MRRQKMNSDSVKCLLSSPVSFLADTGPDVDIAISSRIRLARNLRGYPFPCAAEPEQLAEICELVSAASGSSEAFGCPECFSFDMEKLSVIDREILKERRLASKEFIEHPEHGRLLVKGDESCSIMINEEDQLRMQVLAPGFQLDKVWKEIDVLDNELAEHLDFAFDKQLGYLTCCPTNVGTGMRASVMLHLPGLVMTGRIGATIHGINKLNLAVRGIFGEGSENQGNLFQVSNQVTLGDTESGIIEKLSQVIRQLITHEKAARTQLLERDQASLLDHVGRSYGILRHSYKLSTSEALNCLSGLRIGVDMGLFNHVDIHRVNEMFLTIHPAHLQKNAGRVLSSADRDVFRAAYCRQQLTKNS